MTVREQLLQAIEEVPDALVEELWSLCQKSPHFQKVHDVAPQSEAESDLDDFLQSVEAIRERIPLGESGDVPSDMATNHDHYLYGSPKVEP